MQDRYAGDVGDFGKYALLRALAASDLLLGVVWYLNPDEEDNHDGLFVRYPALRECDESLYDKTQILVSAKTRRIAAIEHAGILPAGTIFYTRPLTFRDLPSFDLAARRRRRVLWLQEGAAATSHADLIFLDPDNGFAPKSVSATANGAQKYVFLDEILPFLNRDQSVVIYHHHARNENLDTQIERQVQKLHASGAQHVWAFTFHRKSVRVFFVVAASRHSSLLLDRSREFAATLWGQRGHFHLHTPMIKEPTAKSSKLKTAERSNSIPPMPRRDVCEIWDGQRWNIVGIDLALEIRMRHGGWPGGRCQECHEQVRPHKRGITGQRAHFEHLNQNPKCSRSK